jgi:Malectin domain
MADNVQTGLDEARQLVVGAELTRLLDSPTFRNSKRCREFLEYTVQHTITGPSGTLKERSIGVELFHLPPDFDTGQHTIVRVTANEVRKKLARHYLSENGSPHPVRIDLPPGSYSAEFTWGVPGGELHAPVETLASEEALAPEETLSLEETLLPEETEVPTDTHVSEPPPARKLPVLALAGVLLVVAGAVAWWQLPLAKPGGRKASPVLAAGNTLITSAPGEPLRMTVGSNGAYTDRSGRKWGPDQFFTGGSIFVRSSERILRTLDPDIYRHVRQGEFQYDIPLQPGSYEMRLHFAETGLADFISADSSGEGQRIFGVSANGKPILRAFDVVADADGTNTSDERVFRDISPAPDGQLHLKFAPFRGTAILSGIELIPVSSGKVRPIRIRAGWTTGWQDASGQQWQADSYFLGGNALVRSTNPARERDSVPDMGIYAAERWGHFSYAIPVAEGHYKLTLRFCEGHYGRGNTGVGGAGSRVFDVYSNGVALMRNFDIFKQAGGEGRPVDRVFSGIRPNAQGKIVLTFVPVTSMACVNGIEVVEELN